MSTNPSKNSIQQAVLEKIRAGKVHRLPRIYFIFQIIAVLVVSMLLFVSAAFVISFILFSYHESGEQFLIGFGWQGIILFFKFFPWLLSFITILLTLLLEWLLKGFKFGYRMPILKIFTGIVVTSVLLGILISLTPLHTLLLYKADQDDLPIVGPAYEQIFDSHEDQGISRGVVMSVATSSFVIKHDDRDHDPDDESISVLITPGSNLTIPQINTRILVFGLPKPGNVIIAKDIKTLGPE
jgi:hypothetical protein